MKCQPFYYFHPANNKYHVGWHSTCLNVNYGCLFFACQQGFDILVTQSYFIHRYLFCLVSIYLYMCFLEDRFGLVFMCLVWVAVLLIGYLLWSESGVSGLKEHSERVGLKSVESICFSQSMKREVLVCPQYRICSYHISYSFINYL